jgi:hypothetical protein
MMLLEAVARYLDAHADVGASVTFDAATGAGNLYLNRIPASPANVVSLFNTGGYEPRDSYQGGDDLPTIQVRVRHSSLAAGEALAWALYEALHRASGVTLADGRYLHQAIALQPPAFIGRDENNLPEYTFNVRLETERD